MKIFPLKPMSAYDRIINLYNIMTNQTPKKINRLESDIVIFNENKSLKKGRSVCDMLSE